MNRIESIFDRFFEEPMLGREWSAGGPLALWEDDDRFHVEAELPGIAEADVEVTVHNGMLFIRGVRKAAEGRTYLYNGRTYGRFERVVTLPGPVDTDHVEARLADGLLTITLPKSPDARPKKITLQAS